MANIGFPTLMVIILVALLLFGPKKLPELGRAFGKTLREFKKGAREVMEDDDDLDRPAGSNRSAQSQTGPLMTTRDDRNDDRRLPE
jgi:sec-independent protein translocase protein TatA